MKLSKLALVTSVTLLALAAAVGVTVWKVLDDSGDESDQSSNNTEQGVFKHDDGRVNIQGLAGEELSGATTDQEKFIAYDLLGREYMNAGQYDKALEQFLAAKEIGPAESWLLNIIAEAAERSGNNELALEHYNLALVEYQKQPESNQGSIDTTTERIETLESGGSNF